MVAMVASFNALPHRQLDTPHAWTLMSDPGDEPGLRSDSSLLSIDSFVTDEHEACVL